MMLAWLEGIASRGRGGVVRRAEVAEPGTNTVRDQSGIAGLHRVEVRGRVKFRWQGVRQMHGGTGWHGGRRRAVNSRSSQVMLG
jgi:hypothetical protein